MAGAITKHQKLAAEKNNHQEKDTSKFYHHFLFKAVLVAIFFIILPLFPSQAPQFINQSLVTRNWELLHILFVGIAISYGLFSRRNDDEGYKENAPRLDNTQNLVARFLQVSSFFEDEAEAPSEFSDETKVQTWSNQHYRNEPVVVVTPQAQKTNLENRVSSVNGEKPLFLPVRSLKSRLSDDDNNHDDDSDDFVQPFNMSNSSNKGSKRLFSSNSMKARNAELEVPGSGSVPVSGSGSISTVMMEKMKENNVVLPSPIPWRSRSGKFESKQDQKTESPVSTTQYGSNSNNKASMEESEFNKVESRSLKSQSSRSSRTIPSPKLTSPSPKEPLLSSSPSPPPNSIPSESLAKSAEDVVIRKKVIYKSCPPPPPPPPPVFQKSISMKPRYGNNNTNTNNNSYSFDKELKRSFTSQGNFMSMGRRDHGRKVENDEYEKISSFGTDKFGSEEEEQKGSFLEKVIVETDDEEEEEEESETEDEDHEVEGGRRRRMMQKEIEETSVVEEGSRTNEASSDVDKKADEFIAKFREQIRLQRIESIKRSTKSTRK